MVHDRNLSTHSDDPQEEKLGNTTIRSIEAKSILNKASGFIKAYDFTLNPYKGCQYGCSYCYAAAFSPNSKMRENWGNWAMVKKNAATLLEKELQKWANNHPERPPSIYMSTVTDPYQPIETKKKLTRSLLEIMIKYQPTLVIQTRTPMIVRDLDLLRKFKRIRINMSIPTGSERVRRDFEGRSPSIKARLRAIGFLKHNIPCNEEYDSRFSVTITPLLPTFPEDRNQFIHQLQTVDRVVIQPFHQFSERSLVAGTRQQALDIIDKYQWWYNEEAMHYHSFKEKLKSLLSDVEVFEGASGFGYD
ncbi:MAG: radical SAM protein [Cyanobacteria bacterium J007]|jgi:DNA repair photolyase|nr:MAG: radical SAM protein [Cyanobacteria bacterium J007]